MANTHTLILLTVAALFCSGILRADEQFDRVLQKIVEKETQSVIEAIKLNPELANKYEGHSDSIAIVAAKTGNLELLQYLHDMGADITGIKPDGHSPIHSAAARGQLNVVNFLLDRGAAANGRVLERRPYTDFNRVTTYREYLSNSPLEAAVRSRNIDVVKLLIERGATIFDEQVKTNEVLVNAAGHYHCEPVPDRDDPDWGNQRIIRLLIEMGAPPNGLNRLGETPLIAAVNCLNVDTVEFLLQLPDVEVDFPDENGVTALHFAVAQPGKYYFGPGAGKDARSVAVVKLLLAHRADPFLKTSHGTSPWTSVRNRELKALLRSEN